MAFTDHRGVEATMSYAVVSAVRDEMANLPRLAAALEAQTLPPLRWVIVDTGSTDGTRDLAARLASESEHVSVLDCPVAELRRGAPIAQAFSIGIRELADRPPQLVAKIDADVSFAPNHFAAITAEFVARPELGIASGSAWEERDGAWTQLFETRGSAWGAVRVYRWRCLNDILPLELRMGWDGADELKARVRGWSTTTVRSIPFYHHRVEGERDRARRKVWEAQGDVAHFLGYRPAYLLGRTTFRAAREPSALWMLWGYVRAAMRRDEQLHDRDARIYLRNRQRLRELPARAREALGRGSRSAT